MAACSLRSRAKASAAAEGMASAPMHEPPEEAPPAGEPDDDAGPPPPPPADPEEVAGTDCVGEPGDPPAPTEENPREPAPSDPDADEAPDPAGPSAVGEENRMTSRRAEEVPVSAVDPLPVPPPRGGTTSSTIGCVEARLPTRRQLREIQMNEKLKDWAALGDAGASPGSRDPPDGVGGM